MSHKQRLFFTVGAVRSLLSRFFQQRKFFVCFQNTVSIFSLPIQVKMADAGTGLTNPQLPQFNGKNYSYWSITMRALFASQGIWELVETRYANRKMRQHWLL